MKRTRLFAVLALVLVLACALIACNGKDETTTNGTNAPTGDATTGEPTTGGDTTTGGDATTGEPTVSTELTVTVVPESMEFHAGELSEDDIDLMLGVTVDNAEATLMIEDTSDFDPDVPGTYTITYKAKLGDVVARGYRTIVVKEALSDIAVEVQINGLGEQKWPGKIISFKHSLFVELTEDAYLPAQSGVFKNTSDHDIVLSVEGSHGCSAIIDKNGVVLEGRDGPNGKLVNAENPVRTSSTEKNIIIDGESVSVSSAFAKNMTIPAGGYAIVVQTNYAGSGADADGRNFVNYSVIKEVGTVVRIYWVDTNENETVYCNQKPTISGNSKLLIKLGDTSFDLHTAILAGIVAKDDNGTFAIDDDVTIKTEDIILLDEGGFDINKAGIYTIKLSVTDGELTTEFVREVEVKSEGIITITIGEKKMDIAKEYVAIDQELTMTGAYAFIVYTPAYEGTIGFSNGYGVAIIVDNYGTIVRIYDGASAKYYDADNIGGVQNGTCTATGYITEAFDSLKEGETLIIAPNSGTNNAVGGSRHFLYGNRTVGAKVTCFGLAFESKDVTIAVGDKTFTVAEDKCLYNADITAANAPKYGMLIFDKNYTGTVAINGYGVAIVLDKYGVLDRAYDGANGGYWTVDGKAASVPEGFTSGNYATFAFESLQEGETLVIFPHDGGTNVARAFGLSLRGECGKEATLTGFTFAEKLPDNKVITVGDKTLTVEEGKWLYNADVTAANAPKYGMLIFDKNYTGTVAINGYGVAIVLDKYGVLDRAYDGANGGYWTVDGKAASVPEGFTSGNYATFAFESLQEGETLVIFPHDGGTNVARAFGLSLRGECGKEATLTGFTFEEKKTDDKTITVGDKTLTVKEGQWLYNTDVTAANAPKYGMLIFDKNYNGTVAINGYGVAIVLDKYGVLDRAYDGANGGYWTVDGKAASVPEGFTSGNYATFAFESLQEGETLVIFPHDGGENVARKFALTLRSECGKAATLTGFTFAEKAE